MWPAVVMRGLAKRYGHKDAVVGINLDIPRGCFFGLVGPNGAGKTTTIRMCTGLLRPDAGQVWLNGLDVWTDTVSAKALLGVLPAEAKLFDRLTGRELLEYSGLLRGMSPGDVAVRFAEVFQVLDLNEAGDTLVVDYSTGMRKKIALACAILHNPAILFLDEPFESVDPVATRTIRDVLERFTAGGGTVIFSSHVMEVVERICDRVAIMDRGRIIAEGATEAIRAGRRLEDVFVELVASAPHSGGELGWLRAAPGSPPAW